MDAIAAAQILSEIGYLLRQDPEERFRAKAFSAAAWSLALLRPDLTRLHAANELTTIEGVGPGIAKVLTELVESGHSRYVDRLRERMKQPGRDDESAIDFAFSKFAFGFSKSRSRIVNIPDWISRVAIQLITLSTIALFLAPSLALT